MTGFLLLVAAVVSLWLTGVALAGGVLQSRFCGRRTKCRGEAEWVVEFHGLALLLGIGGVAWGQFLWSLAGGSLGRGFSVGFGSLGILAGVWTLRRVRSFGRADTSPCSAWVRAAQVIVAGVWINLLVQTLLTPQRFWDERAIFGIKGAVLFEDGSIHSETLAQPRFVQYHPRYPLLLPLAQTYIYGWLGEVDDRWSKVIPPLAALGLWLTLAGVLTRVMGRERGWLWTLLLATVPALTTWEYGFLSSQADAVVAGFHGASTLYLWEALRGWRTRSGTGVAGGDWSGWLVGGLLAACALFTKDEGIAFLLVDAAVVGGLLVLLGLKRSSRLETDRAIGWLASVRALAAYLVPVLLLAAAWFWHRRALPTTTEFTYFDRLDWDGLRAGAATLSWSVPHLIDRMFREATTWGLVWWGVLLSGLAHPRRAMQAEQVFLLLDMAGAIAALLVAGMLAPTPVTEHLGGSAHRFLLQVTPTAVLFLAGQWMPVRQASTTDPHSDGDARPVPVGL